MNTTSVDAYLAEGCGRCEHHQTPLCKVHRWGDVLVALRAVVRGSGLDEEIKWGCPCYTLDGKNVVMVSAYRDSACLSFFKGALLVDAHGIVEAPGPNSQAGRVVRFTSAAEVEARRAILEGLVAQAIEIERRGERVHFERDGEPVPDALAALFDADPALHAAFHALTPGRRRSHVLHVAGAKQAASRRARAERCAVKIREGKGFHER